MRAKWCAVVECGRMGMKGEKGMFSGEMDMSPSYHGQNGEGVIMA